MIWPRILLAVVSILIGILFLVEAGIRIVVSIISLIVFVIYRTSEVSPGLIKNENDK